MKHQTKRVANETRQRQRQPQVSCDFCRQKKLKCDRGEPCSSCVARGLSCTGQPKPFKRHERQEQPVHPTSVPTTADSNLLARIDHLEKAVFGAVGGHPANTSQFTTLTSGLLESQCRSNTVISPALPLVLNNDRHRTAKFLDSVLTSHRQDVTTSCPRIGPRSTQVAEITISPAGRGSRNNSFKAPYAKSSINLMKRDDAVLLLKDFLQNPLHMLPIIYEPSILVLIDKLYHDLSNDQEPHAGSLALLLSICANSAYFYNADSRTPAVFSSVEEADQAALSWFNASLEILNQPRRTGSSCLEEVQGRVILNYFVHNMEGCSARFRMLHSGSVAAAREIRLHLIDSPGACQIDDAATREIKRRLWWQIASTDWMLGLTGGPADGTYSVQPRQMHVRYPRNIDRSDVNFSNEAFAYPTGIPSEASCFMQRIRIAEISRAIIDSRAPGAPEDELMDHDQVMALDSLYQQTLSELPPFLGPQEPIASDAPFYVSLQRDIVLLALHSRRARLHRPFLLHDTQDKRYERSRLICFRSARTGLSISMHLLQNQHGINQQTMVGHTTSLAKRVGCIIGHMFMACSVLALHANIESGINQRVGSQDTPKIYPELVQACRLLALVGNESSLVAELVHSLACVLRKYRVQGADDIDEIYQGLAHKITSNNEPVVTEVPCLDGQLIDMDDAAVSTIWADILNTTSTLEGREHLFSEIDLYCGIT